MNNRIVIASIFNVKDCFLYLTMATLFWGCSRDEAEVRLPDLSSQYIFFNTSSNALSSVTWNDVDGTLNISDSNPIEDIRNILRTVNGVPLDNLQKRVAVGDLRYNIGSVTTRVGLYTQGVIDVNGEMYMVGSKVVDDIINIIDPLKKNQQ
jgi:hypothetical protein